MKYILQILNYAASYRGNFMESLECLDRSMNAKGYENIYLFTANAKYPGAMAWIEEMQKRNKIVYFLSEDVKQDGSLIKKLMKEYEIAAIHSHFITMKQFLPIYFATFGKKLPIFMHMHNHSKEATNFLKNHLRRFLYQKCIMVACSESVYHSLVRDYPANQKYAVDNGVNFRRLEEYEVTPKQKETFLIFGFDFFRKGVDLAAKAIQLLRDQGKDYALWISLSTNFEEVEKNLTEIFGEKPDWITIIPARNDVATLYNNVDLFLSPSREEGLPYSVIEAAYCSCGVVMSDISAQVNLQVPYGVWFEKENIEALAEAIEKALKQHGEKLAHMENVKKEMEEHYALSTWAENIEKLYQKYLPM